MNWFFITVAYSGLSPKAPGTIGSIASWPLGLLILSFFGSQTLFLAATLMTLIAVKSIDAYEQESGIHDDKRIVIDELVGMWIALAIAPAISFEFTSLFQYENGLLLQAIMSFIFFRIYDIKKPSIIGRIDREAKGGLGVMGDDIIAGFAAGISSALVWLIISKTLL
ncbi:MAG TPA: phosphatidylglycerophosphatase A [Helicobacteraceae bacterium]|nr:phosphatidylglycerophosphatase A [Helicobacteraceae bacterium]